MNIIIFSKKVPGSVFFFIAKESKKWEKFPKDPT